MWANMALAYERLPLSADGIDSAALAATLAGSITLGCGQFCTNPGVIVLIDEVQPGLDVKAVNDGFVAQLAEALRPQQPHAMLTTAMRGAFEAGVAHWAQAGAEMLVQETAAAGQPPRPVLAQVLAVCREAESRQPQRMQFSVARP